MKKILSALLITAMLSACATDPYTGEKKVSKTAWGTGIGTAVGAGIGALVGGEKGALIGAGIGALGGAGTGGTGGSAGTGGAGGGAGTRGGAGTGGGFCRLLGAAGEQSQAHYQSQKQSGVLLHASVSFLISCPKGIKYESIILQTVHFCKCIFPHCYAFSA